MLEVGKMLQQGGYDIKVLNTIDFKQSMKYNPFRYIRNENDILKLVNCIMENTKGEDSKGGEDFWGATCSQTTTIPQGKKTLRALGHIVNKTAGLLLAQKLQLITQGVE